MAYEHILSPLQVRGKTLKSHVVHSKCYNMFGDAPEDFRKATNFFCGIADAGAATVTIAVGTFPDCRGQRSVMSNMEMDDPKIAAQFTALIDEVHKHGTLCSASLMNVEPQDVNISSMSQEEWDAIPKIGDYNPNFYNKSAITPEHIEGMIQDYVSQCLALKEIGFDMVTFYMSYRAGILANALSPLLNRRTDQYGGTTAAERARLPLEVFRRVRKACGEDFLIEVQISGEEEAPGYTVDDWVEFCKLCEGLVDIFQVRGWEGSRVHVTGFNSRKEEPGSMKYARAFKKRGIAALVAPVGGFTDADTMEKALKNGETDLIAMARGFMADPKRSEKMKAGKGEDITPCLLCMKCLHPSCSVNPRLAEMENPTLFPQVKPDPKRVAVIGGGVSGLRAALEASQFGHSVTLYERNDYLGGQMKYALYQSFKWPYKDYLNWLIRQVKAAGVEIRLNTAAVPEEIESESYDALICALGSAPKAPPVAGVETAKVWQVDEVYGHEAELGHRVVVVGGGDAGRETGLYLAQCGHEVKILTRTQQGYTDNNHCILGTVEAYQNARSLEMIEFAETLEIQTHQVRCRVKINMPRRPLTFNSVVEMTHRPKKPAEHIPGFLYPEYPDITPKLPVGGEGKDGRKTGMPQPKETVVQIAPENIIIEERILDCDSVVVAGGRASRVKEAAAFAGTAPRIFVIGDNVQPGTVTECTLTAYMAARAL